MTASLTLKQPGGGVGGARGWPPSPLWFFKKCFKNVSSKERVKPWFFETFNIIISHIFPGNFIEIPQVVQKIRRTDPAPEKPTIKKASLIRVNQLTWYSVYFHNLVNNQTLKFFKLLRCYKINRKDYVSFRTR